MITKEWSGYVACLAAWCVVQGCGATGLESQPSGARSIGEEAPPSIAVPVDGERLRGAKPLTATAGKPGTRWTTAVDPKPLGAAVRKGLDWVVEHQGSDGGFGQGEESSEMGRSQEGLRDKSNVADTCIAALALVRSGEAFGAGRHARALERAVDFVCGKIEAADPDSLSITDVNGTRVQMKIGTFVDTFLASMLLSEVQARLADPARDERAKLALAKVVHKIEVNQQQDGSWKNQGWAPVLSQSLAGKGLNRASQNGFDVSEKVMFANERLLAGGGSAAGRTELAPGFSSFGGLDESPAGTGSAGVSLYGLSANLSNQQEGANTRARRESELRDKFAKARDESERKQYADELSEIDAFKKANADAQTDMIARLADPQFVAGFGSNGGEEFLSYMNISESLVVRADDAWRKWDQGVATNLERVQNSDGSWSGHHCITGRTFCTSAALLTLMADRTPVPVENVTAAK